MGQYAKKCKGILGQYVKEDIVLSRFKDSKEGLSEGNALKGDIAK